MPEEPLDFAWRVHDALNDWIGKVDFKASVILAVETGAAGLLVPLTASAGILHDLKGSRSGVFYAGLVLLALALLFAVLTVIPQLRRWKSRRGGEEWKTNAIYFGHLRHWEVDKLVEHIESRASETRQLAQQQITMSKIAWRKHSSLQASIVAFSASSIAFFIAALT